MNSVYQKISAIITLLFVVFQTYLQAQNNLNTSADIFQPRFKHLSIDDGLSQNYVEAIEQDSKGFMWFGTSYGLNKYDGHSFTVYTNNPYDTTTISGNAVRYIHEDNSGLLWIKTESKFLDILNPETEVFRRIPLATQDSLDLSHTSITAISEDDEGNIWIGAFSPTSSSVPSYLLMSKQQDIATTSFQLKRYSYHPDNPQIWAIYADKDGVLWIGTTIGLMKLSTHGENKLKHYRFNLPGPDEIADQIGAILNESDSTLWLGSAYGLLLFNKDNGSFKTYPYGSGDPMTITYIAKEPTGSLWTNAGLYKFHNKNYRFAGRETLPAPISRMFADRAGNIWMGSGYGIHASFPESYRFKSFPDKKHINAVESHLSIRAIFEDSQQNLWFSSYNFIYKWDRITNKVTVTNFGNLAGVKEFGHEGASAITEDRNGTVWFVAYGKLLGIDVKTNERTYIILPPSPEKSALGVFVDRPGEIWVVANRYLRKLTGPGKKRFKDYRFNEKPPGAFSWHAEVYQDEVGNIWFTSILGLVKFDEATEKFTIYQNDPEDRKSIYTDPKCIYPDPFTPAEKLWIGTSGGGLNLFDKRTETFIHIMEKDGLPNNVVYGILPDEQGNLWLSTNRGLAKYNPVSKQFTNYDVNDGLQNSEFNTGAFFKSKSGEMFFGGISGFNHFFPKDIANKKFSPAIVFTDFKLFNTSVSIRDSNSILEKVLSSTQEITLSYEENIFSFEFALLDYYAPAKNHFAYQLEGFNEAWIQLGTQRGVTFTNLDPGQYVLNIKGTDSDGVWSEKIASMRIIITPPWWQTWWAYALYVFLALSLMYSLRRYELNRTHLKNQIKLDEVKLKEREEADRMKSRFFANISHEFRTPLTLILGPIEKIKPGMSGTDIAKQTRLIRRNAKRLLSLVNQLLDLSKLEAGKLKLYAAKGNIVPFVKGIAMSFESVAEQKDISLTVHAVQEDIQLYFDREQMAKILSNLLSNAFKFTPDGGTITVSLNTSFSKFPPGKEQVEISVRDTGIGISETELSKLFDRFYQVDSSQTREHEGSGIGLALTKELVDLHHGNIRVESKVADPDIGEAGWTEFVIGLPLGSAHLSSYEIADEQAVREDDTSFAEKTRVQIDHPILGEQQAPRTDDTTAENNDLFEIGEADKMLLLVVEDNPDVRTYIKDSLGENFQIEEARNGKQGVEKAEALIPDLVISDVMMPEMDGNELSRMLKNNEKTSHIPIILLTAKSEPESKLEGLKTGADDYLIKPFDIRELQIRIKNLINIRKKLQEKFGRGDYIPKGKKLSNLDEQFMRKVVKSVESHISEETFGIDQFAKELSMSRMQLHRKLKALTGKSASLYVRSYRLLKAKKMLAEKHGNVSEIAYLVGFSSPAYFAKCFKEEFGFTPSELSS